MWEFRPEAILGLTPKNLVPVQPEASGPESWEFDHLLVSRSGCITLVEFKAIINEEEAGLKNLLKDFMQLADQLATDCQVLIDFAGVTSFSNAALSALLAFNQKVRNKGSRIGLCCLAADVQKAFFR